MVYVPGKLPWSIGNYIRVPSYGVSGEIYIQDKAEMDHLTHCAGIRISADDGATWRNVVGSYSHSLGGGEKGKIDVYSFAAKEITEDAGRELRFKVFHGYDVPSLLQATDSLPTGYQVDDIFSADYRINGANSILH